MRGKLYICATPIGNLEDITWRVIRTLKEVDLIAAEDTRHSRKLLNYFEISTPLTRYHEYNKYDKAKELIKRMRGGENIALVTDAGTPAISDPGEVLVKMCCEENIEVTSLPGATACITALTLSALSSKRFCFEGFLPREKKQRKEILNQIENEERTILFYEAPHHLKETLKEIYEKVGNRKIAVCRELTKKYETVFRGTMEEIIEYYEKNNPRGEYVLVLDGINKTKRIQEEQKNWKEIDVEDHMKIYEEKGLCKKDAMRQVARDRGISRREVYKLLL